MTAAEQAAANKYENHYNLNFPFRQIAKAIFPLFLAVFAGGCRFLFALHRSPAGAYHAQFSPR
jgi:hypothetical protein